MRLLASLLLFSPLAAGCDAHEDEDALAGFWAHEHGAAYLAVSEPDGDRRAAVWYAPSGDTCRITGEGRLFGRGNGGLYVYQAGSEEEQVVGIRLDEHQLTHVWGEAEPETFRRATAPERACR